MQRSRMRIGCGRAIIVVTVLLTMMALRWHYANTLPRVPIPSPALPVPNAYDHLMAAGQVVRDAGDVHTAVCGTSPAVPADHHIPIHVWMRPDKSSLLTQNAKALAMARSALRYDYRRPPRRDSASTLTAVRFVEELSDLLVLDGQVRADQEDYGGALDSYTLAMHLGAVIPRGGSIEDQVASQHVQTLARTNAASLFIHLTPAQLRSAMTRIEAVNRLHVPFAEVLCEEKWGLVADYTEAFAGRNLLEALEWFRGNHTSYTGGLIDRLPVLMCTKRGIMQSVVSYMDGLVNRAKRPYAQRGPLPPMPRDPFSFPLTWNTDDLWCADIVNQVRNYQLLVALQVRMFALENRRLPAALSELNYLAHQPRDLFASSGKLRYRRTQTGCLIYSVGPDGRDNGGTAIAYHPRRLGVGPQYGVVDIMSTGDIVTSLDANGLPKR